MDLRTYITTDATEMAELIRMKEITPQELIKLSFEQLEKVNPSLNMVTRVRKEKVVEEADQAKLVDGPFSGVPMFLKNSSQTIKGEGATSGSKLLKSNIAGQDSNFVKKLTRSRIFICGSNKCT